MRWLRAVCLVLLATATLGDTVVVRTGPLKPFTPDQISGLVLWVKADQIASTDGTAIGTWSDQSGAGHNVTQATSGNQPLYKTGIVNGKPVVRFDGVDDYMVSAFTLNQPTHVFLVAKFRTTSSSEDVLLDGQTGDTLEIRVNGGDQTKLDIYAGSFLTSTSMPTPTSSFGQITALFNSTSSAAYENRVQYGGTNAGTANSGGITLGQYANASTNRPSAVDVAEVVIYNVALTNEQRGKVEAYLRIKYATP